MIKSVTVKNSLDESITINLGEVMPSHGLLIKEIKGLGPVKADINTTELAAFDGTVYNSAKLQERNIVINLLLRNDVISVEEARQLTYKYFPIKKYVTFHIETDRRIAEAYGYVESNEPNIFEKEENTQISILCPDPNFYSAGEDGTQITTFSGITALFEFPFSNESAIEPLLEFGQIENKTENVIEYAGDLDIGVLIRIHALGEAGDITIYSTGTRQQMVINNTKIAAIVGSGIQSGDDIIISTIRGDKYLSLLRGGVYTNILNALDKSASSSPWFELVKGDNVFAYSATYGSENLQFTIENKVVYEGV